MTLWGKADCSLCDKALVVLDRLSRDYPLMIQKRDITLEPDVYDRYRYIIPVVEIEMAQLLAARSPSTVEPGVSGNASPD